MIKSGNPGLTYLVLVIDSSGSMSDSVPQIQRGIDRLVAEQKANGHDEVFISFTNFGSSVRYRPPVPIDQFPKGESIYGSLSGATALNDGIGIACAKTQAYIEAQPEHMRPGRVVVMVQTDGGENCSGSYQRDTLAEEVGRWRKLGWEFLFVGEGGNAADYGKIVGIDRILMYGQYFDGKRWKQAGTDAEMLDALSAMATMARMDVEVPPGRYTPKELIALAAQVA